MIELLHQSIARHAAERPEATAFRCREESITYIQLLRQSNQLANCMRSNGLNTGDRVGIFMGKTIHLPVATYGTLAAGGAYVPIDPSASESRLEFILKNCGIEIIITARSKLGLLKKVASAGTTPLRVVIGLPEGMIDSVTTVPWESVAQSETTPPELDLCENDLAYIMYTSGSTGTPKGLMHTHRSGLAYARYSAKLYDVSTADILGNHAPLHFDISTFEFLTGPYAGATSVLIPEEEIMFPNNLAKFIERERLTFWYSVPLALIQILTRSDLSQVDLSSLRWILFGGEPFPPNFLKELLQHIPNAQFCNVYGPAEVNQCTFFKIPRGSDFPNGSIPLGQIWDGAKGLILNTNDEPTPPNDTGELLVHSSTMMTQYWERPDLDDKAFYYKKLDTGEIRRYYRTGDLVQKSNDGLLYFIGRKDRQIKIRGYRLELDEVELALASCPIVEEAAVVTLRNEQDETELSATLKLRPQADFDKKAIISHIKKTLPHYGIPKYIKSTSDFPRTGSGKIDRNRLT